MIILKNKILEIVLNKVGIIQSFYMYRKSIVE